MARDVDYRELGGKTVAPGGFSPERIEFADGSVIAAVRRPLYRSVPSGQPRPCVVPVPGSEHTVWVWEREPAAPGPEADDYAVGGFVR